MLIDTLGSRVSGDTLSKTSDNMQAKAVVDTPADKLAKMEAAEVRDTLVDVQGKVPVHHNKKVESQDNFQNTRRCEGRGKERHTGHCGCQEKEQAGVQTETFVDALGAVRADVLVEKLGDTLSKEGSETLRNTLSDVEAKVLLEMVADTVAVVENEKYAKN